jgi:hypothetical protein
MNKLASITLLAVALSLGACAKHDTTENGTADAVGDNTASGDNLTSANDSGSFDNAADNSAVLETGNGSNVSQ